MIKKGKSKSDEAIEWAYRKGYRVRDDGTVCGLFKSTLKLHYKSKNGRKYAHFSIYTENQIRKSVPVHRLMAYQKYGDKIFCSGTLVRHLNDNSLENTKDNIAIGTPTQNNLDIPLEKRLKTSINAAKHIRRFSDSEMLEIRAFHAECGSYKQTMEQFGISSKGTLHYMLNKKYQTKI